MGFFTSQLFNFYKFYHQSFNLAHFISTFKKFVNFTPSNFLLISTKNKDKIYQKIKIGDKIC